MQSARTVVGVLGASGGLGASTLSVALGGRSSRQGHRTVVVDGHLGRGGLDVTACIEHVPGLRWADLADAQGPLDGRRLRDALPRLEDLSVLSAGPPGSQAPPAAVVESVVDALGSCCDVVVVDLPSGSELPTWLARCTSAVVLLALSARALADADAACRATASAVRGTWLAVRAQPRQGALVERVVAHLDLPLAAQIPSLPELAVEAARGRAPGDRDRDRLSIAADRIVERLLHADAALTGRDLRAS